MNLRDELIQVAAVAVAIIEDPGLRAVQLIEVPL